MEISIQLFIGILINTIAFGVMGFRNNKLGITVPNWLDNESLQIFITIFYYASFLVILFSPGNLVIKIIICVLMQFLVNHAVWGIITGIIAGIFFKDKK
jgi:hypothetical protein